MSCLQVPRLVSTATAVLPTLAVLRLSSNLLTSLPDRSFSACPGLNELYLNNNSIQTLSNWSFSGLGKLEVRGAGEGEGEGEGGEGGEGGDGGGGDDGGCIGGGDN